MERNIRSNDKEIEEGGEKRKGTGEVRKEQKMHRGWRRKKAQGKEMR